MLSSNEVCLVPENYPRGTYLDNKILIDGRYLPFKFDNNLSTPLVNYRLYKSYPVEGRIDAHGAYFSSQIDSVSLDKILNDDLIYHFVSPSTLKKRGESKGISVLDDELYIGKSLSSKASDGQCYFFDYSSFDFGPNWSLFPNYSGIFPKGVKAKYGQNLSTYLAANEILVSDASLQKIGDIPHFNYASLRLNHVQEEVSFVLKNDLEMRLHYGDDTKERIKEEIEIWGAYKNASQNAKLWLPLLIVSFLFSLMEKRHRSS